MPDDATAADYFRARFVPEAGRAATWQVICRHLARWIPPDARVLDLGAGYCSFVNAVDAAEKHALDAHPGFVEFAAPGVRTHVGTL